MVATLVTVAAYDNVLEAGYWQAMLEAEGIPVVAADREIVAMQWQISGAVGNIKLQVPEPLAGRAREVLETHRRASPYRPPEAPEASRALLAAFLGLLFWPLQIYSIWLLVRLFPRRRELLPDDRRRMKLAAMLDLLGTALAAVFWSFVGWDV
jgi:hypothetical protein